MATQERFPTLTLVAHAVRLWLQRGLREVEESYWARYRKPSLKSVLR